MTITNKTQTRGICQCCGREQAVLASGFMAKHGYEVKDRGDGGWFHGVCSGQHHKPMQIERAQADRIIASVRADVVSLLARAADLKVGKVFPDLAASYQRDDKGRTVMVSYLEAEAWQQRDAVTAAIYKAEQRARAGESFANGLSKIADEYHGQPLRIVAKEDGPAPILNGDKRTLRQREVTATGVNGAKVYWMDPRGFKGSMSSRAWRALPGAAA
jgi:hypothetical protein